MFKRKADEPKKTYLFRDGDEFTIRYYRANGRWYMNNDSVGIDDETVFNMIEVQGNVWPKDVRLRFHDW